MSTGKQDMATQREGDPSPVKITREIPLHYVLTVVGAIAAQALVIWSTQRGQADAIASQAKALEALTMQVKAVADDMRAEDRKTVEFDWRLVDGERRISALESQLQAITKR